MSRLSVAVLIYPDGVSIGDFVQNGSSSSTPDSVHLCHYGPLLCPLVVMLEDEGAPNCMARCFILYTSGHEGDWNYLIPMIWIGDVAYFVWCVYFFFGPFVKNIRLTVKKNKKVNCP